MEETDELEDGEIVDYDPLPRPTVAASSAHKNNLRSKSTSGSSSESTDSDADDRGGVSRKKQRLPKKVPVKNKYNVWASELQASELMDELTGWDSGLKNRVMDKSRDVESYYHFSLEEENEDEKSCPKESDTRKRRFGEKVDLRSKLGNRSDKETNDSEKNPRYLSELKTTSENTIEDITRDITLKLCEEKEDLVMKVVTVLGKEKAIEMFNKTRSLEEQGGMMIMNGSRRRTPGGVFLQLIKKDAEVSKEQKKQIFFEENKTANSFKKSKSKAKKMSNVKADAQTNSNMEDDLPPLLDRKELILSMSKKEDERSVKISSESKEQNRETRCLAVYDDDMFDDNPYDIELT